jgi:cell wall-associated NlpC family hydrolase
MNPLTLIDTRLGIRLAAIALVALLGLLVVLTLLAGSSAADCLPDSHRLPGPAQDAANAAQRALDGQPDTGPGNAGADGSGSVARLDADQVANAAAIVQTGQQLGIPARGQVIALATARQESSLRNVTHGDQAGPDSRGLFQQRAAWGPEADRLNPSKAATMFYTGGHAGQPGLLDIPGWQTMTLTRAAQAVQRSAHPDAYADDEAPATRLLAVLAPGQDPDDRRPTQPSNSTGTLQGLPDGVREQLQADAKRIPAPVTQQIRDAVCPGADDSGLPDAPANLPADFTLPPGTPAPVQAAIAWALQQRGGMYSFGGDCTQPLGAAAAHRCDCSSLIQQAYSHAGIPLPRTTSGQRHAGAAVPDLAHVQAGDLVFIPGALGTPAAPRHVSLALGHGLVLHAPGTGKPITVTTLSGWNAVAIRRVVG